MRHAVAALCLVWLAGCRSQGSAPVSPDASTCVVDSACAGRNFFCLGPSFYQRALDLDCKETCGPGPCTGSTCVATGPRMACPSGSTCTNLRDRESPCVSSTPPNAQPDAGLTGSVCEAFCTGGFRCTGATRYRPIVLVDCSLSCGNRPCNGFACGDGEPEVECAPGLVCRPEGSSPCGPPLDAGPDAPTDGGVQVLTVSEGHACSVDPGDHPRLECSRSPRLVCVSTYRVPTTRPPGGLRNVFLCRLPCATTADCPPIGDVCCPGEVSGPPGTTRACVPPSSCETLDAGP
jgi:hypothetical protein